MPQYVNMCKNHIATIDTMEIWWNLDPSKMFVQLSTLAVKQWIWVLTRSPFWAFRTRPGNQLPDQKDSKTLEGGVVRAIWNIYTTMLVRENVNKWKWIYTWKYEPFIFFQKGKNICVVAKRVE